MKTLSAVSLAIQKKIGQVRETIDRLILYKQYSGEIVATDPVFYSDFDDGTLTNWSDSGTPDTAEVSTEQAFSGSYSAKVTNSGATPEGLTTGVITIDGETAFPAGTVVDLSIMIYVDLGANPFATVRVELPGTFVNPSQNGAWHERTITGYTLPSDGVINLETNQGSTAYFDNIRLKKNAGNDVTVSGDATSQFSSGDTLLIPLKNFEQELTIESISYDSGNDQTNINVDGLGFSEADIGKTVCSKIDITTKLVKDGLSDVTMAIEGNTLNDFDDGLMRVVADNSNGYFQHRNGTGVFDSGAIFWGKYLTGFKGAGDNIIYFGGLVDLTDLSPDLANKTLEFKIKGHADELKRIPAFHVIDESETDLIKIPGFEIFQFDESADTEEGIKRIRFRPFTGGRMQGVEIISVSFDTEPGLKVFEFRYPNLFRWDNGNWTEIADTLDYDDADNGTTKLLGYNGSSTSNYAVIKFGDADSLNEYPDRDVQVWVDIKSNLRKNEIGDQGEPTLQWDNGEETPIRLNFKHVVKFDDSLSSYTDVSFETNYIKPDITTDVLEANDDELIIIANETFYGIEAILETAFSSSSVTFHYSTGGTTWSGAMSSVANGLSDETSGLTQDGVISWDTIENWQPNVLDIDPFNVYKGYAIRIVRVSASGTATVREIRRLMRLRGENDDFITIKTSQADIETLDQDDELVVKFKNSTWTVAPWYQNVALHHLLTTTLDESNYDSSKRTLSDMKVAGSTRRFNLWGKPPKLNYRYLPTAVYADVAGETVYTGVELELWQSTFSGIWSKLINLRDQIAFSFGTYHIRKLWKSGNSIWMLVYRNYDEFGDEPYRPATIVWLYEYDTSSDTLTLQNNTAPTNGDDRLWYPMNICLRDGKTVGGPNYSTVLGQDTTGGANAGENVCIPFPQNISCESYANKNRIFASATLDDTSSTSDPTKFLFTFGIFGSLENLFFRAEPGYYCLDDSETSLASQHFSIGVWLDYGHQGCVLRISDEIYIPKTSVIPSLQTLPGVLCELTGVVGNSNLNGAAWYNRHYVPHCIARNSSDGTLFFGWTQWYDDGDDTISYSYLSRQNSSKVANWDIVWKFNTTGSAYTNITSNVNNQTTVSGVVDEVGDIIYFGMEEEFRHIGLAGLATVTFAFEYWNGSSWTTLPDSSPDASDSRLIFSVPRNWSKTTVNGSASLYFVRCRVTAISASSDLISGLCHEQILLDTRLWTPGGAGYARGMPTWLEYNPTENALHCIFFNRESATAQAFPFQWDYFVIDLDNPTGDTHPFEVHAFNNTSDGIASNFTFDGTLTPRHLRYTSYDDKVYLTFENLRYEDSSAFLANVVFSAGKITITREGVPQTGEFAGATNGLHIDDTTGNIYGLTSDNYHYLWEYATEFWPRVELARFSEGDTAKSILSYIAERSNSYFWIQAERYIRFLERESYNGSFSFNWGQNMIRSRPSTEFWRHYYDAVRVEWQSQVIDDLSGNKKRGFTGFQRKVLDVSNPLVQSPHAAKLVADTLYNFFNQYRVLLKDIEGIYLIDKEILDKFNVVIPSSKIDLSPNVEYIVSKIRLNPSTKQLVVEGIEIFTQTYLVDRDDEPIVGRDGLKIFTRPE